MCDRMLKALAANARRDLLDERFDLAWLQSLQDSRIGVVAEEREELRDARRVVGQCRFREPTHMVEVVAVRIDELLARSLHRIDEDALLVEIFRERPDQRRQVDIIFRIPRRQLEELNPRELIESANAAPLQGLVDARHLSDTPAGLKTRVSLGIKPHDEPFDVWPEQRERGDASVKPWI